MGRSGGGVEGEDEGEGGREDRGVWGMGVEVRVIGALI